MPTRHSTLTPPPTHAIQGPQALRTASAAALAFALLLLAVAAAAPGSRAGALVVAVGLGAVSLLAGLAARGDGTPDEHHIDGVDAAVWVPVEEVGAAPAASWDHALLSALSDAQSHPISVVSVVFPRPNTVDSALNDEHERQLQVMAVRWRETLRPGDHLARLGADHFALVLRSCGPDATPAVLERLRRTAPEASTLIAGVATWDGVESPSQLMLRAEEDRAIQPGSGLAGALEDPRRLEAALRSGLIERGERPFDGSAASVAWLLGAPIVTIALYDATTQHLIGDHGALAAGFPAAGQPAMNAICREVVESGRPLVVTDIARHPTLSLLPSTSDLGARSCAAVPIIDPSGLVLGTVCAISTGHHRWSTDDLTLLRRAAARVAHVVGERRASAR